LHNSDFGKAMGFKPGDFPNSLKTSETILRLPIHTNMSTEDASLVAELLVREANKI
jgi:dTDP-4-amino-4,6-dideoxygalactose transaminase